MGQRPLGIAFGLIAGCGQFGDAVLERRIIHVDDAVLDRVIEPLELGFRLGRAPLKVGDMLATVIYPFVAAFKDLIHQSFEPCRVEQPRFEMIDHRLIEPFHRHGDAGTAGGTLPCLRRAGIVTILPAHAACARS
ncbi:hypothetical protein [Novosphingobium sp. EMRT-2]|uniref:hypothetical protein n=1 Tax=Novosphingobium sp. EMRT-2 TaxID=2571749 RepID=UPI002106FACF|nr:hypothetical protein [Novosphingobium sp. EMRT-2]